MATFELTPEEMELFLTESAEQVDTMEELLVTLEKGTDPDAVSAIFRAAHTLKGGAATAGMEQTARLTHALESLLDQVRNGEREADGDTVDALLEAVDLLRVCLSAIEEHGTDAGVDVAPLSERLEALVANTPTERGGAGGVRRRAFGGPGRRRRERLGGRPGCIRGGRSGPGFGAAGSGGGRGGPARHPLPRPGGSRRGHAVHPPLSDFDDSRRTGTDPSHRTVAGGSRRRRLGALAARSDFGDGSGGCGRAQSLGRSVAFGHGGD